MKNLFADTREGLDLFQHQAGGQRTVWKCLTPRSPPSRKQRSPPSRRQRTWSSNVKAEMEVTNMEEGWNVVICGLHCPDYFCDPGARGPPQWWGSTGWAGGPPMRGTSFLFLRHIEDGHSVVHGDRLQPRVHCWWSSSCSLPTTASPGTDTHNSSAVVCLSLCVAIVCH